MNTSQAMPHPRADAPSQSPPSTGFWALPSRALVMGASVVAAALVIAILTPLLKGRAGILVLDHPSLHFPYPFTIQNIMHVVFFIGLGELFVRWRVAVREEQFVRASFLPEDHHTVLMKEDLGPILHKVEGTFDHEHGFLPSLVNLSILQFQSSNSVEQATAVMNQHLELMSHRLDLRYGLVRFIAWIVPTLGFIGTVFSLGASLSGAGNPDSVLDLHEVARTLGVGFDCTMVALVESAILVFILHIVQEHEERALNHAGDYALRHLINRLYAGN